MRVASAYRLSAFAVAVCAVLVVGSTSLAGGGCAVRAMDEVLEVNVRQTGCSTDPEVLTRTVRTYEYAVAEGAGARQWMQSDLSRLTESPADGRVTIFYIHGNKVDTSMARDRALRVYYRLVNRDACQQAIRFVIFSWPASEIDGLLRDFRVKAARTRPGGCQLAWVLNQMPPDARISLLGYSYGARLVGGGLHVLAGGNLSGTCDLGMPLVPRPPMRVVFIAAATHSCWFGPGGYHRYAMNQIDTLLMLNNELDPAMRFYHLVDKNCHPQAMGLCGPTSLTSEARSRVECYDCSNRVGRSHDLFKYTASAPTMSLVWNHLIYTD